MRFLKRSLWGVFAGLLLVGGPAVAGAQCTKSYRSIESRIGAAESAYYGSISGVKRTVVVPRNGTRKGSASKVPDGVVRYELTIKVEEFLKGPKRDLVQLVTDSTDYDKRFEQWAERKSTFLFFVDDQERAFGPEPLDDRWPQPWTYLRLNGPVPGEKVYVTDTPPLFSKDKTVLRKPAEILTRARDFAKLHPRKLPVHAFTIPHALAELCSPSCDANFLVVPIEPGVAPPLK